MTAEGFEGMDTAGKTSYLRNHAVLVHSLIRGIMIISLFWTEDLIFEVFKAKNTGKIYDIKVYDRFEYAA